MYFAITVGSDKYLDLQNYFMSEGFAYRVVPVQFKSENGQIGGVDADTMYNNMMHKFKWGNMNDPNVYLDENNTRMAMNVRNNFVRLADALLAKDRKDSAITVLDKCAEIVPNSKVEYNYFNLLMAEDYFKAGANDKAKAVMNTMLSNYEDELNYFFSLQPKFQKTIQDDIQRPLFIIREMARTADKYGEKDLAKTLSDKFTTYVQIYSSTN
jgi:tetratricopeptide (TPR) repeat protein